MIRQEYTEGGAETVVALVESVAATPVVGGVFLLVGEDAAFTPTAVESTGDSTPGESASGSTSSGSTGDPTSGRSAASPATWDVSVPVFGGVFPAVIHDGRESDVGTVVVGLPATPEFQSVVGLDDETVEIRSQLDPGVLDRGHETAFVLADAYADRVEEFVGQLFDTYGVEMTFVGGGTGGLEGVDGPSLFTDEGVVEGGAVVASTTLGSSVGVEHGWEEVAGPLRVTDSEGRTVHSIDGEPAFERYSEVVADHAGETVDRESFFEFATAYPLGISRVGGEPVVRDPYAVGDGSIDCFGAVPEGEFVHILRGDRRQLVTAARTARTDATGESVARGEGSDGAETANEGDDGAGVAGEGAAPASFVFDCISRSLYFGESFTDELTTLTDDGGPTVGALTIGEITSGGGRLEYHNKTTVVARFVDG